MKVKWRLYVLNWNIYEKTYQSRSKHSETKWEYYCKKGNYWVEIKLDHFWWHIIY